MNYSNVNFTMALALKVQKSQLAEWRTILNDRAYNALESEAKRNNKEQQKNNDIDPYHVWRGEKMANFMANLAIQLAKS